ncbi:MAG: hypothetical protein GX051_10545 [Clostridiales bacterium]|nr:hypothetical protein [Clostridiales bacterium]
MRRKALRFLLILCAVAALGASACVSASAVDAKVVSAPSTMIVNTPVSGALTSETDYEEYVFSLTQPGVVQLSFAHSTIEQNASIGWKITLYEQYSPDGLGITLEYREITYNFSGWSDEMSLSNNVGLMPGNYKVKIEAAQNFTGYEYTFNVKFTPSTEWEDEFNDSFSRYTELTIDPDASSPENGAARIFGSSSQRNDGTSDSDYFMFELDSDKEVNVTFSHENLSTERMVGWKISVFDESFNEIAEVDSGWTATSVSTGPLGLPKGHYYIHVASHIYSGSDYMLLVTAAPLSGWETEINDTVLQANALPAPGSVSGALSPRDLGFDKDYYKVTVERDGCFTLKFSHANLGEVKAGWNIVLMDENSVAIHKMVSYWNVAEITSPKIGLPAGTYYIRIDSDSRSFNSEKYLLTCDFLEADDWETENNNSPVEADALVLNKSYNGTLIENDVEYDKDYYKFTISGYSDVRLMFMHQNLNLKQEGWVISILNDNSENFITVSSSWDQPLTYSKTITLSPGTYYICVDTGMYYNSATYSLTLVDITPPVTGQSVKSSANEPEEIVYTTPVEPSPASGLSPACRVCPACVTALPPEKDESIK